MLYVGNLSWHQFEACNPDPRTAFEHMCRRLFLKCFCQEGTILHSNPNNPGIEVDPVQSKTSAQRISFQSKYFDSQVSYAQIRNSAETAIKYYSGKLDVIYLYSNKDISTVSKEYQTIEKLLDGAQIKIVPITNQSILDSIVDFPALASLYFHCIGLSQPWFERQLHLALESMGQRYNGKFNINTAIEESVGLFVRREDSLSKINARKADAIDALKDKRNEYRNYSALIDKAITAIASIDAVTKNTILECLQWSNFLAETLADDLDGVQTEVKKIAKTLESVGIDETNYYKLYDKKQNLEWLTNIPDLLEFDPVERLLLQQNVLILRGEAGTGKSQLLANTAKQLIDSGHSSILLLGQTFLTGNPIFKEIPNQLGLPYDLDALLTTLDEYGESNGYPVVFLIDALNESTNLKIWKTGLPQLISIVEQHTYIRLVIAIRSGYESQILDEALQERLQKREIISLVHNGFQDESISAVQEFLNHYGIPFSPEYYLQHEMTNPLFLTLFCKTYDGSESDISTLFDRIIKKADEEAQDAIGLDGTNPLLIHFIGEFAETILETQAKSISEKVVFNFNFWDTYGLTTSKLAYLSALKRFGLIITYVHDNQEYDYLSYNLLEDFVCARKIMEKHLDKEQLYAYIIDNLLPTEGSRWMRSFNEGIFIALCGLFAEKYHEECISVVDALKDSYEKRHILEEYIQAYLWRRKNAIDSDYFLDFINNYHVSVNIVWPVLIECSTKAGHPLNALFLHKILKDKPLNHRDYIWTTYINGISEDESRIASLILYIEAGEALHGISNESLKLLLILCTWMLTSSNRYLRDKVSKAMVELLKEHFEMAQELIVLVNGVNDPYVVQRLYGVVFGACTKRITLYKKEYTSLVNYVAETVFNQTMIYPDILMRDYARLIIERYIFEFPDTHLDFELTSIRPPYKSEQIPMVTADDLPSREDANDGIFSIAMSMSPDLRDCGPGLYGDFGRYVFQAAVNSFEGVGVANLYHYAMQFIRDTLGYKNEIFGNYDTALGRGRRSRHETKKTERIGKKYQWIAFYNILARLSDTCQITDWNGELQPYQGPWRPYVRDFDPTLNIKTACPGELPYFDFESGFSEDIFLSGKQSEDIVKEWTSEQCPIFQNHHKNLFLVDSTGTQWICLFCDRSMDSKNDIWSSESFGARSGTQRIWSMSKAFLIKDTQRDLMIEALKREPLRNADMPDAYNVYELYNRESGWAPGYYDFYNDVWTSFEAKTGEKIIHKEDDDLEQLLTIIDFDGESINIPHHISREWSEDVKKYTGEITPAFSQYLWEEGCDASQEESTSFIIPCRDIIRALNLEQKAHDGYFHTKDGSLAAFDGGISNVFDGFLIRKDLLDLFLTENELSLIWVCTGEKQYFQGDHQQVWKEWEGLFVLLEDGVSGELKPLPD